MGFLSSLGKLIPKGGLRDPNRLVRSKELYVGNGSVGLSPLVGGKPNSGKALLTGTYRRRR